MDQLQLLYDHTMIQPLLQSRWYLLHGGQVKLSHLIYVTTLGGQLATVFIINSNNRWFSRLLCSLSSVPDIWSNHNL